MSVETYTLNSSNQKSAKTILTLKLEPLFIARTSYPKLESRVLPL